ncbi:MAG: arginase family protein [Rhodobacter sp.]|nr:arginase family protein [Rhodobacter sp.]
MKVEPSLYSLAPNLRLGRIGQQYYMYDGGLGLRRLAQYKSIPISAGDHDTLQAISDLDLPASLDTIREHLKERNLKATKVDPLVKDRLIVEHVAESKALTARSFVRGLYADRFEQRDMARIVQAATFFNVPQDLGAATPVVGIKGVPLSTLSRNKGTEAAPDYLRHLSGGFANWFDIHRDGVFSDLCLGSGVPTIAQDLVIADLGNFDFQDDTLATIFGKVDQSVCDEFLEAGVRPLFVGGDHAITFPVVDALQKRIPDLGLLHLDAHHDVLFGDHIQYSHASVISNLIFYSGIDTVFSFGLRTRADLVGPQTSDLLKLPHARRWWSRASTINDCRRYLMSPSLLDTLLKDDADRPYFLTIDLDVLSPDAISGRVMTPVPDGLSWSEFFGLLEALFERLDIVGCDITELNPYFGTANEQTNEALCLLLLYLIEKLGR